jgi:uncharacterized protein YkwD
VGVRRIAAATLAGAVALVLLSATAHGVLQASGPCQAARASTSADPQESLLVGLINSYRQQNGLGTLSVSPALTASAEWKSGDMLANNYFAHDDPSPSRAWYQRIADCGYGASRNIEENLAEGVADAQSTLLMWENSPPHNENLLDPSIREIGVGRAGGASQSSWYWTADFGDPVAAAAAPAAPSVVRVPSAASGLPLTVGATAGVSGTGDCLRVHTAPAAAAPVVTCLPDGFVASISDGPQSADGYTWWKIGPLGWAVSVYLVATTP